MSKFFSSANVVIDVMPGVIIKRTDTEAVLELGDTRLRFKAAKGESILSAKLIDGCSFLVGTDKRVLEWNTQKGWRTLAHAEDRT